MTKQVFGPSAPSVEIVQFRGEGIETRGLKYRQLIELVAKFPSIVGMLDTSKDVNKTDGIADDAIDTIVAMGTGVYGDETQMGYIAAMSAGEKAAFIAAIIRQTAPTGIVPFVELLLSLGATAAVTDVPEPRKNRSSTSQEPPQNLSSQDSAAAA